LPACQGLAQCLYLAVDGTRGDHVPTAVRYSRIASIRVAGLLDQDLNVGMQLPDRGRDPERRVEPVQHRVSAGHHRAIRSAQQRAVLRAAANWPGAESDVKAGLLENGEVRDR
jgi:hypothetical protein